MILIVNLNASLDKKYTLNDLKKGSVLRALDVHNTAGGKGVHVANVLTILDEDNIVTGFLGGKTGEFIEDKLKESNINQDFVKIKGSTRECLAIMTDDLFQTEILEPGPTVTDEEQKNFLDKYNSLIKDCSMVVASGSVPKNVPKDFYKTLIEIARNENKKFLLDTSGELLKNGIEAKPFFIKPNKDEIEALTGRKVTNYEDAIKEIKEFHKKGIEFVVISLGGEGSVAGFNGNFYKVTIPKVTAVNPVGSGDSYVAGIALGLQRSLPIEDALKFASACGTANAVEEETGFVNKNTVEDLFNKITVTIL